MLNVFDVLITCLILYEHDIKAQTRKTWCGSTIIALCASTFTEMVCSQIYLSRGAAPTMRWSIRAAQHQLSLEYVFKPNPMNIGNEWGPDNEVLKYADMIIWSLLFQVLEMKQPQHLGWDWCWTAAALREMNDLRWSGHLVRLSPISDFIIQ